MSSVITDREIKVLEYDQIRQKLADMTISPMGKKMAEDIVPAADYQLVSRFLKETGEARLICSKNVFNPSPVNDINPYLTRVGKGASLSGSELAIILTFLKAARRWELFFKNKDHRELYPTLNEMAAQVNSCPELFSALEKSIAPEGNIMDTASSELASLRRKKASLQNKIRDKLDEYLRGSGYRRYLQESLVTIRNGRYVLPVKQEYRQNIQGVVHDQSASGATVFIEPLAVVNMQNEVTSLQRSEEQEIDRILVMLSAKVDSNNEILSLNSAIYAELDYIIARGLLSLEMNGIEPRLCQENNSGLYLENARHPLLTGKKVPLQVELGGQVQTLVVTGPNTGGKTVALKTIGLLTAMAQSGLHIPAGSETRLTVFKRIRADIGDEQSIAQSLSTFSGHMGNIIEIIKESDSASLVLFDELGAGTDPSEGAALAMAILGELTAANAITVATTHINELKLFAQLQENMQNAAMEFDPETLTPTYRLLQGVPGQSNAFYIASQLGLPEHVLEKAKTYVHRSHDQVESVIASLVEDQQRYHRDSRQAEIDRSRAEILLEELEKEREMLKARREDILSEARHEAREIIKKAKTKTDQIIRELRTLKNETEKQDTLARAEQARQEVNELRRETDASEESEEGADFGLKEEDLTPGLIVFIRSLKQKGEVVSFNSDEALVQVGAIKVHLPLQELRLERGPDKKELDKHETQSMGSYSVNKDMSVKNSIDLRGLNLDEARPLVDKLLDNALWAGLSKVDIIHGKGTGKLKQGLRSYLKEHSLVTSYRSGSPGEGGEGVTVVEIKK
ncbi:MAG: endonuclease MutS2 [Bacillota bacterium]